MLTLTPHARLWGIVIGVIGASGTMQSQGIRFDGTATISSLSITRESVATAESASYNLGLISALNTDATEISGGSGRALSSTRISRFEGIVNSDTGGTFEVYGRE